jgi:hypothetical protein
MPTRPVAGGPHTGTIIWRIPMDSPVVTVRHAQTSSPHYPVRLRGALPVSHSQAGRQYSRINKKREFA